MKKWQLAVCLENEDNLLKQAIGQENLVEKGREEIDEQIIINALGQSKKQFYITNDNNLVLYDESIKNTEKISIKDAYVKYGGDIITQVFDYGSCKISG